MGLPRRRPSGDGLPTRQDWRLLCPYAYRLPFFEEGGRDGFIGGGEEALQQMDKNQGGGLRQFIGRCPMLGYDALSGLPESA
jgi:hypothetical protein